MFKNKRKGVIIRLRESRTFKGLAVCLALNLIFEIVRPNVSLALTEGPSQPEVQSFEPITTNQMVDLFSGDFNYNIPLFNLPGTNGGYPVNLAYHAGVTMDDEASWVGLGWNINVGSLNRSLRGLPDEFESKLNDDGEVDGTSDHIEVKSDIKPSWTLGLTGALDTEAMGLSASKLVAAIGDAGISPNMSIHYNNYNGMGASLGVSQGIPGTQFSYGISLSQENGLGVSASYTSGASKNKEYDYRNSKFTISFDGSLSVDYSLTRNTKSVLTAAERGDSKPNQTFRKSLGSGISFARNNYVPAISSRFSNYSLSFGVKAGPEATGIFANGYLGLFFNTQDMNDEDKNGRKIPVIGYAKAGNTNNDKYTRDFIRANDGQITKESRFLALSQYAYDAFHSTGQGLSGHFRARRSDIGRSFDPRESNLSFGLSGGIDYGAGLTAKVGIDAGASFGRDAQGPWNTKNGAQHEFKEPEPTGKKENVFYKVHGESTILRNDELNHIDGTGLSIVRLKSKDFGEWLGGKREITVDESPFSDERQAVADERVVRNTLVHTFKNKEVKNLGEFNVKYLDYGTSIYNDPNKSINRTERAGFDQENVKIGDHPAGYKVLNNEGSYYVYGLPAYNNKEVENMFTVKRPGDPSEQDQVSYDLNGDASEVDYKLESTNFKTDKFIRKSSKSPYAHSYLLTSVQGADYVDVTNNGPSDDDLGYWVKFNYVKYADNYNWRAPYHNAQYIPGKPYTSEDDKGMYKFGEKEMWYLGQIETKSHIAIFKMSERLDMKESSGEHASTGTGNFSGLKIDEIEIYDKEMLKNSENPEEVVPLKVVHLDYNYSLCKGTQNSAAPGKGKLTLKSVYFTNNGSDRGIRNKYKFDYGSSDSNPNYARNSYDQWGGYKPLGSSYEHHSRFPYVNQFNQDWNSDVWEPSYPDAEVNDASRQITKQTQDELISSWLLKKIELPSGGIINVDYESDDYGYVQHKTANQMFKIHRMGTPGVSNALEANELYKGAGHNNYFDEKENRRIYFKLEEPIAPNDPLILDPKLEVYQRYVAPLIKDENGQRNLYFKTKVELNEGGTEDYVNGYAPLEDFHPGIDYYGVSSDLNNDGKYQYGFVTLKRALKREKSNGSNVYFSDYHPIALAAWIYMQTDTQKLLKGSASNLESQGNISGLKDLLNSLGSMMNFVPSMASSFGFIRSYCESKNFARYIDLNNSVIKLASPDKVKYGGGHRVREISITDSWSLHTSGQEESKSYGQKFDYTIEEEGRIISSGVAQYEPQAGGDENALKYPVYYFNRHSVFTKNNLFAEAPFNESLFPGASVGYRKVTVKSSNTELQIERKVAESGGSSLSPTGRTGGVTVHEFYTSKEFPVITENTILKKENDTKNVFNVPIPIPLVGSIKRNFYHGTQGYLIELNDMHGKPKSVKTYELNDYTVNPKPITSSEYQYQTTSIIHDDENVYKLDNQVNVTPNLNDFSTNEKRLMGIDYDVFTDQREQKSFFQSAGLEFNTDVIQVFPGITVWPSFSNHKTMMRTYVTNKVIHRTGILKKTISKDLQTSNETEILAYDEKSGTPLVTRMKNEFGDYLYQYKVPAHYAYDRMGHAYKNINYNFKTILSNKTEDHFHSSNLLKFTPSEEQLKNLVRGDELITFNVQKGEVSTQVHDIIVNCGGTIHEILGVYQNTAGTYAGYFNGEFIEFEIIPVPYPGTGFNFVNINTGRGFLSGCDYQELSTGTLFVDYPEKNYSKCYFLGWEHSGDGVIGLLSFIDPPGSAQDVDFYAGLKVVRSGRRNHYSTMAATYLTKGLINEQELSDVELRDNGNGSTISTKQIESDVLSASATVFNDNWAVNITSDELSISNGSFTQAADRTINPFISGSSGIFRPYKSYAYVGKRKTAANMSDNTTLDDPNLREDGAFEEPVEMFTWELGNIEDYASNWEWVNEITKYSNDSYQTENMNRLGIYSSALYGYDNSLSIAVGSNASYHELGAEDFETASGTNVEERMNQNNLNFYKTKSQRDNVIISEAVDIKEGQFLGGNVQFTIENPSEYVKHFFLNASYNGGNDDTDINTTFGLSLNTEKSNFSEGNKSYYLNGACTYANYTEDITGDGTIYNKELVVHIKPYAHCFSSPYESFKEGELLYGKATLLEKRDLQTHNYSSSIEFTSEKSHTGNESMKISSEVVFDQPMLKLISGKKYIASLWVSRTNDVVRTFQPQNLTDLVVPGVIETNGQFTAMTNHKIKYGKVVEGWQKIDLEFALEDLNSIIGFKFKPGVADLYVDDFRFSPKTGGISTYVYDSEKMWLRATLNVDNYATLYFYDEEGNLTLKKQETEEGIFTVTESRGHIYEPDATGVIGIGDPSQTE